MLLEDGRAALDELRRAAERVAGGGVGVGGVAPEEVLLVLPCVDELLSLHGGLSARGEDCWPVGAYCRLTVDLLLTYC